MRDLSPDADCVGAWSAGKIAQRKFANDGLTMTGFVMENSDGSREFININSVRIGEVDRTTLSWVERGLHTLLAEGSFSRNLRPAVRGIRSRGDAGRGAVSE